ncbi:MAG: hypothetical protein V1743_02385 [Nanoarchaeota archaeon]
MTEEKRICSKCKKIINGNNKFCPSCGGKVVNKEEHRVQIIKKRKIWLYFIIPIVSFLIVASVVIFAFPFQYKAIEAYNVQEPYTDTIYQTENEPYQDTEYYTNIESGSNCDVDSACSCLHKSWLGLGSCDSCSCTRSRTVTKYRSVEKPQTVTKYRTVQKEKDVWKKDTLFNMWTGKIQYYYEV